MTIVLRGGKKNDGRQYFYFLITQIPLSKVLVSQDPKLSAATQTAPSPHCLPKSSELQREKGTPLFCMACSLCGTQAPSLS